MKIDYEHIIKSARRVAESCKDMNPEVSLYTIRDLEVFSDGSISNLCWSFLNPTAGAATYEEVIWLIGIAEEKLVSLGLMDKK